MERSALLLASEALYTLPTTRLRPDQYSDPTGQISTRPDGGDGKHADHFDPAACSGADLSDREAVAG